MPRLRSASSAARASTRSCDDVEEVEVDTPYGKPSAPVAIGRGRRDSASRSCRATAATTSCRRTASRIARTSGRCGRRVCAGSSARAPPARSRASSRSGEFVVCDQFVDRTRGRADTFYDGPETTHVSAADPYCPDLRGLLVETARERGIPGPGRRHRRRRSRARASRRAPSRAWFQDAGWDAINMTAYPEGHLARELELCYANDRDGHRLRRRRRGRGRAVSHDAGRRGLAATTTSGCASCCSPSIPKIGPQPGRLRDSAPEPLRAAPAESPRTLIQHRPRTNSSSR